MIRVSRPAVLIAAVLAMALSSAAHAQTAPPDERDLAQARAELARAAARVAELSHGQAMADASPMLLHRGARTRPVLGVVLAPDDDAGVRVSAVTPGSAAAEAGLRSGDRLLSIDGTAILGSSAELRVDNARKLVLALEAETPASIGYERDGRRANASATPRAGRDLVVIDGRTVRNTLSAVDLEDIDSEAFRARFESIGRRSSEIALEVSRALSRSGLAPDCAGEDCTPPMLLSAFRWSGLNLAALDPQLGRYFGTDRGVLVLSTGELQDLQPGDVIQRVDGEPVSTPREVMAALRDKPAESTVAIAYLRDRESASARIVVPRTPSLRIPAPPAPPSPPAPPQAPPSPPSPPTAPAPRQS